MEFFKFKSGQLVVESVPVKKILQKFGTPTYIYSYAALRSRYRSYEKALRGMDHLVCYSMKCNSNLAILSAFAHLGSGIDIVSQGELFRALKVGASPKKIVFSGVGKTEAEIRYALKKGILMFNVESEQELEVLDGVALSMGKTAPIAVRVNPDINPKTHPYITTGMKKSKFGIQYEDAIKVYLRAKKLKGIRIRGIDCHIGSQLTQVKPFVDALKRILHLVDELKAKGIEVQYLDIGGGLGIHYQNETPPSPQQYVSAIKKHLSGYSVKLLLEPGRSLMGNAGILTTKVLYTKSRDNKHFLVVDAAMNDLIRPAFYNSYHEILPVEKLPRKKVKVDVVGPVCETGDFLATDRLLPAFASGEYMAVMSAGAYGFAMASNYNTRPKACEILVRGNKFFVIRKRESYPDLIKGEIIPKALKRK